MWYSLSVGLAALLLLADGRLSSVAAGPEKVGVAYPMPAITLDGDLSDWPDDMVRYPIEQHGAGEPLSGPDDFAGEFRVGYNRSANVVYVAVDVRDDSVVRQAPGSPHWEAQDGIEVYLHGQRQGAIGPTQYWYRADQVGVYGPGHSRDATVAARWRDDGYQLEWRIDMHGASDGTLETAPGLGLAFDVAVWDVDSDGAGSWIAWSRGGHKYVVASQLGRLALLEAGASENDVLHTIEETAANGAMLSARTLRRSVGQLMFFSGVLLAFTVLHLLLFLFDPSTKPNLFYAVYTGLITAAIYVGFELEFTAAAGTDALAQARQAALLVVNFFGLWFLYSLFRTRPPRRFWLLAALVAILTVIAVQQAAGQQPLLSPDSFGGVLSVLIAGGVFVEILIALVNAVRKRVEGAWIIGIGFTVFALNMARFIQLPAHSRAAMDTSALYWVLIPLITMSVYLARSVGRTNRVLNRQLREIEQLSQTTQEQYRQIQEQNVEIQEANRLKSDFLARMSHDLRTPMNAIIGYVRILLRKTRGQLDERQYRNLENVNTSAQNLLALISDILDISRIEAGRQDVRPEEVDVGQLVGECAASVESLAKPGVVVAHDVEPAVSLHTDPDRLRRVLMNLLSNAVKYTEEGSVAISVKPRGEELEIVVTDTGVGIPAADLPHIFDEFRQVERADGPRREGTGLGLAIVKRTLDLLGGSIRAVSEVGRGSTFTVTIGEYRGDDRAQEAAEDHTA